MITAKSAMAEEVVGTGESWLTELSDEELKATLALSPGTAVDEDEDETRNWKLET
ncbi:MAG: hypothetical protein WCR06_08415 [bacterium]